MDSLKLDPQGPFKRDPLAPHQMRQRLTRTEDVFVLVPPRHSTHRTGSVVTNDRRHWWNTHARFGSTI